MTEPRQGRRADTTARDLPRPRDMPPPREGDGAAAPAMRRIFDWPFRAILAGVVALRLSAMQLTFLGLATNGVIGWLLVEGHGFLPGMLLPMLVLLTALGGFTVLQRGWNALTRDGAPSPEAA